MRPACHLDTQNTVFGSLDTQKFILEFANDDFSKKIEDVEAVVSLLLDTQSSYWPKKAKSVNI